MATPTRYTKHLWIFLTVGALAGVLIALAMEKDGFAHLNAFFANAFAGRWNADMAAFLSMLLGAVGMGVTAMLLVWLVWTRSKDR
jgi:hypothetical protein